jgi:hypothetical protein
MKNYNTKNITKLNVWLVTIGLILTTGSLFCQQIAFEKRKNLTNAVSNILNKGGYDKMYTAVNKVNLLDTAECLEVSGRFDGSVKDFNGFYIARLISNNKVVETQILNIRKSFLFTLKKNMLYAVRLEKQGYISKTISISTHVSDTLLDERNAYLFNFQTNLLSEEIQGRFDDDDIDFPVALIGYNKICDCFDYNKEYTAALVQRMVSSILYGI